MRKVASFILTISIQFLAIISLKLLDNFFLIIMIFIACLLGGRSMKSSNSSNSQKKEIGWGIFYGSLTSLTLTIVFIIWLVLNYPK